MGKALEVSACVIFLPLGTWRRASVTESGRSGHAICQHGAQEPKTGLKNNGESRLGLLFVRAWGERLLKQNRPCPAHCSDNSCIR